MDVGKEKHKQLVGLQTDIGTTYMGNSVKVLKKNLKVNLPHDSCHSFVHTQMIFYLITILLAVRVTLVRK